MSRSNRGRNSKAVNWVVPGLGILIGLLIAFGLGALFVSTQTYPPTKQEQQQYAAAKARYARAVAGNLADTTANYTAYPDQNASECYYADNHDSGDLCAQWRAAIAAEKAAEWTRNGVWFGLIGTGLSALALGCLLWSLRQTERSLKRALKANRIARKHGEAQVRPWLQVDATPHIGFKYYIEEELEFFEYTVRIKIKNVGQSPAIDASYISTLLFFDPTPSQLSDSVNSMFSGVADDWRDKNLFPSEEWNRNSGAAHYGKAPGRTPVNLLIAVRYRTSLSKSWKFSVKVYSLGRLEDDGICYLEIPTMSSAANLGRAYFQQHQSIAGIAS